MRFTLPLLALAALAAPAAADDRIDVRVSYADLDVTSPAGRAALEARLAAKLRRACTFDGAARYSLGQTRRDERCVAEGLAAAKAEVERVALLQQRRGRAVAAN